MGKILFLFTSYPLWSETFLRQDLMFLQRTGLDIQPAALFPGDCTPQPDWPVATVLAPDAPPSKPRTKPSLKSRLLGHLPRPLYTALSLRAHRHLLIALEALARQTGATHIHAEFADLAALLAARAAQDLGLTFSVGIHAFDIHATRFDLRAIFNGAKFITVCNQAAHDACLARLPNTASRLHLIYHGVNLNFWQFLPTLTNAPRLLFIGRLVPKKGIAILLQALAILRREHHLPAELTIVGTGPLETELRDQAHSLGLDDAVVWSGFLTSDQIHDLLPTMACLCAPSIVTPNGDRDGIPNVILEAMASGLPVVASQVGSIAEAITPQTGWPVPDLTPQTLAEAIRTTLTSPNESDARRRRARQLVAERFDAAQLAHIRAQLFA